MRSSSYFLGHCIRNSLSGHISLVGIEPKLDFWVVDLYDRAFACDAPENVANDPFLFKVKVLKMRT